jgi:hypothetical protein
MKAVSIAATLTLDTGAGWKFHCDDLSSDCMKPRYAPDSEADIMRRAATAAHVAPNVNAIQKRVLTASPVFQSY